MNQLPKLKLTSGPPGCYVSYISNPFIQCSLSQVLLVGNYNQFYSVKAICIQHFVIACLMHKMITMQCCGGK